jgi:hypothetical protein
LLFVLAEKPDVSTATPVTFVSAALSYPSTEEVASIAAETDPVIRNLRITWSYYRLNRAMSMVVGDRNLSWCGFAIWASKTAGSFIRQEEVPSLVERWVEGGMCRAGWLPRLLAKLLGIHPRAATPAASRASSFTLRSYARAVLTSVSMAIATGNRDVFAHIAPPFSRLLSLWAERGGKLSREDGEAFVASLRSSDAEHGDDMARAFAATLMAAADTADLRVSAQAMLYANALIGCVEQRRVQPAIVQSLNSPVADLFFQGLHTHLHSRFPGPLARLFAFLLRPLVHGLESEFHVIATEWLMKLQLPGTALRLGQDVPPLPDERMYPVNLDPLDHPEPLGLYEQLGATDAAGSAARDWTNFDQRMRYIGVLFRSRQEERLLFEAPFTDAQVIELDEGRVPSGDL